MRRYLETMVRILPWMMASLILIPLIVGGLSHYLLGTYQATASLWVESASLPTPSGSGTATTAADLYARRMQQLLMTRTFRDNVLAGMIAHGGVSLQGQAQHDTLLREIGSVEVVSRGANLIDVEIRNRNPKFALATVGAAIEAFQKEMVDTGKVTTAQTSTLYQQQIQQAQDDVVNLQTRLSALPSTAPADQRARLTLELGARSDLLKAIEDRRTTAYADSVTRLADAPTALQVIDPAQVENQAKVSSIDLALAVVGAFLVTLALGLVVIGILTRFDRSIRTAADVRALTAVPVITVPRVFALHENGWPRLARRVFGTWGG